MAIFLFTVFTYTHIFLIHIWYYMHAVSLTSPHARDTLECAANGYVQMLTGMSTDERRERDMGVGKAASTEWQCTFRY